MLTQEQTVAQKKSSAVKQQTSLSNEQHEKRKHVRNRRRWTKDEDIVFIEAVEAIEADRGPGKAHGREFFESILNHEVFGPKLKVCGITTWNQLDDHYPVLEKNGFQPTFRVKSRRLIAHLQELEADEEAVKDASQVDSVGYGGKSVKQRVDWTAQDEDKLKAAYLAVQKKGSGRLTFVAIMKDPMFGKYFSDKNIDNVNLYNKWKTLQFNKRTITNSRRLQRQTEERDAKQGDLRRRKWTPEEDALLRAGMRAFPATSSARWTSILDDPKFNNLWAVYKRNGTSLKDRARAINVAKQVIRRPNVQN